MSIKIIILDDDSLIVGLLQGFLSVQEGIEVLETFHDGRLFIEFLDTTGTIPDVLLLDMKMQGMDGVEVSQRLRDQFPEIKIIVISSHYHISFLGFMLKTGVASFLPKGVSPKELVHIVRTVHERGFYFMEDQMETIKEHLSVKSPKLILEQGNELSNREIEVLRLLCKQKTAKEIGTLLFIAQRTVEGHKNNLFIKTGAKNIAGLIIYSIQHSIIKIEDLPAV